MSASELKSATPHEPEWIVRPFVAAGNITLIGGKPKAGKSTWALALASSCTVGRPFLEQSITAGPVVYLSEESAGTLAHKLPVSDHLRVLSRENAWPKPDCRP